MSAAHRDFLVEIGTEEYAAKSLLTLATALADGIAKGLTDAGLEHRTVERFATPRRLAVRVRRLAERQPDRAIERRGPPPRQRSTRKARRPRLPSRSRRAAASR